MNYGEVLASEFVVWSDLLFAHSLQLSGGLWTFLNEVEQRHKLAKRLVIMALDAYF
jgi:hypothetical protein